MRLVHDEIEVCGRRFGSVLNGLPDRPRSSVSRLSQQTGNAKFLRIQKVDMSRRKQFAVKVVVYYDQPRGRKNVGRLLDFFLALYIQFRRVGDPKEYGFGVRR